MEIAGQNEYVRVFQEMDAQKEEHIDKLQKLFSEVISNTMIYMRLAGENLDNTDEKVQEFAKTLKEMKNIVFEK